MKKLSIIWVIIYIFSIKVYADDALEVRVNTIYPIFDTSVQMVSENVELKKKDDRIYVRCEFVLKNRGEKEEAMVGFPAYETMLSNETFKNNMRLFDVETYIDGEKVPVILKKGLQEEGNNKGDNYYPNWYVWKMVFENEQVHKVVNTYWIDNAYDGVDDEIIKYILKSGSIWNGSIEYGEVSIEFDETFDPENFQIIDYESYRKSKDIEVKVLPENNKITWEFYGLEPDFNIAISYRDYIKMRGKELLEYPYEPRDKELFEVQNISKKAYEEYIKGNYDRAWENMNKVDSYKESKDKSVSRYALKVVNLLDYYRAMILSEKGEYEEAAYYFKTNGIFEDRNLYKLAKIYKISGDMDGYIQVLKKAVKGEKDYKGIAIWAEEELNNLPKVLKEKYGIVDREYKIDKGKNFELQNKIMKKESFSYKSFILFNTGIVMLLFVAYWNIRKK